MPTILYTPTSRTVTMKDDAAVASTVYNLQQRVFQDARRACNDGSAFLEALHAGGTLVIVADSEAGRSIGARGLGSVDEEQLLQQLLAAGLSLQPSAALQIHLVCSLSATCVRRDYVWEHQSPFAERFARLLAQHGAGDILVIGYAGFLGESGAYTLDLNTTDNSKTEWQRQSPSAQWQVSQGECRRLDGVVWMQERQVKVELRRRFSVHLTVRQAA